ncbi:hypothetical protein ASPZODRAFT_147590 [Penicilliopsis zonata CBS 506.65]|uniref:Uncharacterized protein n=1 Tax=Penicilliopsis zonata CBS 506.65 TaxID=1073090 RepID=A0A1L9S554_9EURO|nr:hypothetical protein ASPZODRAFT_147590 [Penicilliopsis zonata CBS 506.65]OJJ42285.1 hypothetical protein ASPZODRAFT_147590 [Penicilliopsis zonata CBS 506.65]
MAAKYHQLHDEDRPRQKQQLVIPLLLFIIAILSIVLVVVSISFTAPSNTPHTCGHTRTEALARGCTWDHLVKAWLPADCPRVGEREYLAAANNTGWIFYDDPNTRHPIADIALYAPLDEYEAGLGREFKLWYTTEGEHLTHCAYMLKRLAYSVSNQARIDDLSLSYPHSVHCLEYLLRQARYSPTWDNLTTVGNSWVGRC